MTQGPRCVVCERPIDAGRGELKACKLHIREAAMRDVDECAKWGVSMTMPLLRLARRLGYADVADHVSMLGGGAGR